MKFLTYFCLAFSLQLAVFQPAHAQDSATATAAVLAQATQPQHFAVAIAATPAPQNVSVPEPAAPPQWATDLLMNAARLPVVGPYISKALLYLGILTALLTSLVAFLLGAISLLQGAFNISGLGSFASLLATFKDGKIMYWLKFFSNFNAKKPE
jgi:hypothetical protein